VLACAQPSGVWGLSFETGELKPFACGSPRCEACAPRWGSRLKSRLAPILPQMVDWWKFGQALKFGTLTLPGEFDATSPSFSTVAAEAAVWRRFRRALKRADPTSRIFAWKREVGSEGGRLHRHFAVVTKLSNRALKLLAARAGAGRVVNFKRASGGALARYLAKYVAKVGSNLAVWPSRTRWAQTIIPARWPDQPRKGGRWLVHRFGRLTSERVVLGWFDARLVRPESLGVATHGEVWSPLEDGAWAPRPPPRGSPPRLSTFGRMPRA
jgi:hypothetical protein